jgi:hypothetical protein
MLPFIVPSVVTLNAAAYLVFQLFKLKYANLGKASKNHVLLVCGKATLIPDIRAECRTTAPTS